MPRVLRIINRFNLGGPTYNAAYLTKYLPGDFETLLVGGMKEDSEGSSMHIVDQLGLKPVILNEMRREVNPLQDRLAFKKIKQLIQDFKPDVVHTHASKPGALGRLAAAQMKVPVIVHTFHGHSFHSYFNPITTSFYRKVERFLASKSNCIVALSEGQKNELVNIHKVCPEEKVRIIPLGFDLARFTESMDQKRLRFRTEYGLAPDEIAIGIIGRLVPIKNHDLFLRSIAILQHRTQRKIRAFVVGDGEERARLEALCNELNLTTSPGQNRCSVTFTSWIKDIDYVNAGIDIVCLTSKNEGTPVSLIEAQAANKPIVTTRVGGIENIVVSGRTALLSETNNHVTLANNLLRLVEDDALREEFGADGWLYVHQKFHYQRLADDMAQLYQELLN
ncbi:MAG: glycosyltransferase family 1 protein [Cryomorphaceae bacterium]|nr:MAG: glycosyltransferase family 1 protein [Cryomorphaceae bacterium]